MKGFSQGLRSRLPHRSMAEGGSETEGLLTEALMTPKEGVSSESPTHDDNLPNTAWKDFPEPVTLPPPTYSGIFVDPVMLGQD